MSDRSRYLDILAGYLSEGTALDPSGDQRPLRSLGVSSLRAVDLAIELEAKLGFTFDDELFTDEVFATTESLWRAVQDLLAKTAP